MNKVGCDVRIPLLPDYVANNLKDDNDRISNLKAHECQWNYCIEQNTTANMNKEFKHKQNIRKLSKEISLKVNQGEIFMA